MCGISGIINNQMMPDVRNEHVRKMNSAIFHRGPDEHGFYSDKDCTLAMRRLSIIDISSGKQPIYSNDGKKLIFFNGEIYNYRELKALLQEKGYTFHTQSDTEVVVNLFQQFGPEMVSLLKGMFAFCIYQPEKASCFFARDRFGEKPLFYYQNNNSLYFSSEISSLLKSPDIPRKLNEKVLGTYLRRSFVPDPDTLFLDIKSVPPGHYLIFQNGTATVHPYFTIEYKPDRSIRTLKDAAEFIRPQLEEAVRRQMVSDVPIGAFLSGGIDSSTVVALMQKFSSKPVQTFNVKFQTKGYDESIIAREVAKKIGTDHHEIVVGNNQFREEQFWKILHHVGVPFPDSSAIPTDIVTEEISKYVKVALSGDGGDELFAGYEMFEWYSNTMNIKKIPQPIRKGFRSIIALTNKTALGNNKLRRIEKALNISFLKPSYLLEELHALFEKRELEDRYTYNESEDNLLSKAGDISPLRLAMKYRLIFDLPLDMLVKVDRMSMRNSLEVRAPFLDPDLFEASSRLPDEFLRSKSIGKIAIREIMKNDIPNVVFNHPKSGFSIPLHDFRNDNFRQLAIRLLNKPYMKVLFDQPFLDSVLRKGLNDNKDDASGTVYRKTHQLWSLMMLSGWIEMFSIEI